MAGVLLLLAHAVILVVARRREVPGFRVFSPRLVSSGIPMTDRELDEYRVLTLASATSILALLCWLSLLGNTIVLDAAGDCYHDCPGCGARGRGQPRSPCW